MIDVKVESDGSFDAAVRKLKGADKAVRKEFTTAIRAATAPAEAALKKAVMNIEAKGSGGGGGKARREHNTTSSGRLPKHTGLRRNVARGITRKITTSGNRVGVRIRADTKYLPADQKKLAKLMNSGKKFRHPVMGNRNAWVSQQFGPGHWFDNTMKHYESKARQEIQAAARRAMAQLQ